MSNLFEKIWVGIDVAKARLDVSVGETGQTWSAGSDEVGIAKTVERLGQLHPRLVVESTGGLESHLVRELYLARVPVALVNPSAAR